MIWINDHWIHWQQCFFCRRGLKVWLYLPSVARCVQLPFSISHRIKCIKTADTRQERKGVKITGKRSQTFPLAIGERGNRQRHFKPCTVARLMFASFSKAKKKKKRCDKILRFFLRRRELLIYKTVYEIDLGRDLTLIKVCINSIRGFEIQSNYFYIQCLEIKIHCVKILSTSAFTENIQMLWDC